MGKTPSPLVIYVDYKWLDHPALEALREKGHTVEHHAWLLEPDLILHPAAHAWDEKMFETKYLEAAIKAARKRKKKVPSVRPLECPGEITGEAI